MQVPRILALRPGTVLASALLFAAALPSAPAQAGEAEAPAATLDERLGRDLAAIGRETELSFAELDRVLVWRHALAEDGRAALRHLLDVRVLERLGEEQGVTVTQAMLNGRWEELDREVRSQGVEGGLPQYLRDSGVDEQVFRDTLRLAIVHEVLTRRALGIPGDGTPTTEQQTMWLEGQLKERGYSEEAHPWAGGVVARCGDVTIGRAEFLAFLRDQLPSDSIADACYQLLLEKRIRARMPDLSEDALQRGVATEIDRRRAAAEANPVYQGIPYAELLKAKGLSIEALRHDPAIRVAALAQLWVDRANDDAGLRDAYEADREFFDGRYGEGVEVRVLLLRAAKYKNELIARDYGEAEDELIELRSRMRGALDFERLARLHSEDSSSRENGGLLGVVTRGAPGVPEALRQVVFAALDAAEGDVAGTILGPVRLPVQGAAVLACLGARRPTPTWESMTRHVHRELRGRLLEEVLPRTSVRTWLDAD